MNSTEKSHQNISKSAQPTNEIRERWHTETVTAPSKYIGDLEIKGRLPYKKTTKTLEQKWIDGSWRPIPVIHTEI